MAPVAMQAEPGGAPTQAAPKAARKAALKSMTGFAQARAERDDWQLRVSIRSVNHRFLDLRLRLPEGFERFEPVLRQLVNERLRRGHVDVTLRAEPLRQAPVAVHREVAAAYLRAAEELRREFNLAREPDLAVLLRLPGVVAAAGVTGADQLLDDSALDRLGAHISDCVGEALTRLEQMRQAEGRALAGEMHLLLDRVAGITARLNQLTEAARPAYAQRLNERLAELLGAAPPLEPARLAQEAALLAERADVSEELARLRSHTSQFSQLIDEGGELGKKLDFLLQEMQREANTLLSKTPGLGAEGLAITDLGLEIKSEIEKLREQVQNVE